MPGGSNLDWQFPWLIRVFGLKPAGVEVGGYGRDSECRAPEIRELWTFYPFTSALYINKRLSLILSTMFPKRECRRKHVTGLTGTPRLDLKSSTLPAKIRKSVVKSASFGLSRGALNSGVPTSTRKLYISGQEWYTLSVNVIKFWVLISIYNVPYIPRRRDISLGFSTLHSVGWQMAYVVVYY